MLSTLAHTIASRSPQEANEMLMNHGYQPARNVAELEYRINEFILDEKDTALDALALIHPDRGMFSPESHHNNGNHGNNNSQSKHSNCCGHGNFSGGGGGFSNCSGCGGKCGGQNSNASGSQTTPAVNPSANQMISGNLTTALIALTIIGVVALTLIKHKS